MNRWHATAGPGLPTLPATAVAVDTSPAATIEVNLGMMHLQTLLVQCSFDVSLYVCTAPLVTGDSLPCTQPGADCCLVVVMCRWWRMTHFRLRLALSLTEGRR